MSEAPTIIRKLIVKKPNFTGYQKAILESKKRFTITEASTKSGKSYSHIYWLFELAHKGKLGQEYWWIAPIYSQSEIAFKRMARAIAHSQLYTVNISKLSITTPKGTIIRFKSAEHPDGLYGENVYGFVFDEFSRAKEEAWHALRTTVSYTQAPGKFIGNVTGRNWAWELARRAEKGQEKDFEYFRVTAKDAVDAGILKHEEVERARQELPARVFKMLYEAQYVQPAGALWGWEIIENFRIVAPDNLKRIVVGVDPSGTSNKSSDEAGIVVAGQDVNGHVYILADESGVMSPNEWADKAVKLYHQYKADRIVAEVNMGWDMVENTIRTIDKTVPVKKVVASRGKMLRAEPVVALYEQGRVHHTQKFKELEEEMTEWDYKSSTYSPDRIDALVYAVTELAIKNNVDFVVV